MIAIALTRFEDYLHLQTIVVSNDENRGIFDVFNTYDGSYVFQWENERTHRLTSYSTFFFTFFFSVLKENNDVF